MSSSAGSIFPKYMDKDYKAEDYFQSFVAQAFVGRGRRTAFSWRRCHADEAFRKA